MSKYLLPCECGKGIVIDASQAGQQIACECGVLLEIPTLRGVRALETVDDATSDSRRSAEWDSSRGLIFAGSLILFVIGAVVAYFGYDGLRATPKISREAETESFDKAIDDMSLEEVYETWKTIREHGLGARGQNVYVNIRKFRADRQRVLTIGIALCVGGLLGAIGATLGRRKSSA
jgi:hypothetical protein